MTMTAVLDNPNRLGRIVAGMNRALGDIPVTVKMRTGVKDYTVSLDSQTADVTAEESLSYEAVLEKIKKTGKTVNSGEADGVAQAV